MAKCYVYDPVSMPLVYIIVLVCHGHVHAVGFELGRPNMLTGSIQFLAKICLRCTRPILKSVPTWSCNREHELSELCARTTTHDKRHSSRALRSPWICNYVGKEFPFGSSVTLADTRPPGAARRSQEPWTLMKAMSCLRTG